MQGSPRNACHAAECPVAERTARALHAVVAVAAAAVIAALGPLAAAAAGATLTVNTLADTLPAAGECSGLPADCSVREALDRAQSGDEVVIPPSAAPYLIVHEKVGVRGGVTIAGAGAEATTLSGAGTDQVFNLLGGAPVTIRDLEITHGHNDSGKDEGGAINGESATGGELILERVTVSDSDSPIGFGGAIETGSNLVIRDSRFADNSTATTRKKGGGGAIDLFTAEPAPLLTISDSVFEGNTVDKFAGGAVLVESGATLVVSGSTFVSNVAGNGAPGGAIQLDATSRATILNSTFTGNAAGAGGAISAEGERLTMVGDTFAFNAAEAGASVAGRGGSVTVENTILAAPEGGAASCSGSVTSEGNNLEDSPTSSCGLAAASADLVGVDPLLGPFALNSSQVPSPGGPPPTFGLQAGSPAIGAGEASACAAAGGVDERGFPRPGAEGSSCDVGAFEVLPPVATTTTISLPAAGPTLSEPFTLRAAVAALRTLPAAVPQLTGTVEFLAGSTPLGTSPLGTDGSATLIVGGIPPGIAPGPITAVYGGDAVYAGSVSPPLVADELAAGLPAITGLRQSHLHWREGGGLARIAGRAGRDPARQGVAPPLRARRTPAGTTFHFRLSAPAALRLAFRLRVHGRAARGRCVPATSHNRRARLCRRWVAAGALALAGGRAGSNSVFFDGVLSGSRRLAPGLYRMLLTATNAAGSSAPVPLVFRIVRR